MQDTTRYRTSKTLHNSRAIAEDKLIDDFVVSFLFKPLTIINHMYQVFKDFL